MSERDAGLIVKKEPVSIYCMKCRELLTEGQYAVLIVGEEYDGVVGGIHRCEDAHVLYARFYKYKDEGQYQLEQAKEELQKPEPKFLPLLVDANTLYQKIVTH